MSDSNSIPLVDEQCEAPTARSGDNELVLPLSQAMQQANRLQAAGEWRQAEQLCRLVLDTRTDHFEARQLLGVIALQTQRPEEALSHFRSAVAVQPDDANVHRSYAEALMKLGRLEEALDSYERALALAPDDAAAHNGCGATLRALKRHEEALRSCERALRIQPDYAEAHFNRSVILQFLGRSPEALESYQRVLQIWPKTAEVHYNCGILFHELRRFDEALAAYARALEIRPNYADAYTNRGHLLSELGRLQEALADLERAREIKPESAEIYINLGNVLRRLGRVAEALDNSERALSMAPQSPEAHLNHGAALYDRNEPRAAIASYDRAIALRPDFASAYQNRAYAALLAGDFAQGWADHEWRWKNDSDPLAKERRSFQQPLWLGEQSLSGKRILLHTEQGFGDTLQFCRYVRWVADLGATVLLEAPALLAGLLASLDGVAQLVLRGEPLPAFDFHCPLLSLPLAFKTVLGTIPSRIPYLKAPPAKVLEWQQRLGERRRLRVGLVWSGGFRSNQPELWTVNERRNMPLAKLAPLRHPEIEFYSLQKGKEAEAQLVELTAMGWPGPPLIDCAPLLNDFADTAALMENLDLVLSVDTATVHLAGALGRPVWLLNRFDTCWRWLLHRVDSPWYPTLTIYRQSSAGDWDGVVANVSADLTRLAAGGAQS